MFYVGSHKKTNYIHLNQNQGSSFMRALNTPTSPDSEVLRGKRNDQTNIDQG